MKTVGRNIFHWINSPFVFGTFLVSCIILITYHPALGTGLWTDDYVFLERAGRQALVLLLYWQTQGKIDKDYSVFAHLIDEQGKIFAGNDGQPRGGIEQTSLWRANQSMVDWIILPITTEVPPGEYRLELGLYYLPTLERLTIVDNSGRPISDKVVIESFEVVE